MAKVIMIQGTMSNAGKSLVVAGLCRVFAQDGYRVAPFKSQNMALNSFITEEGLEMGRAQVVQAEAAGIKPSVCMNPILLKPTNDVGSQVIVNGKPIGNMSARDYFAYKTKLIPDIMKAYRQLEKQADIIVVEGAGSPAEINLKENDIVNMGLANMLDAPVLLVGDIDRGGVFAQLLGTIMLLEPKEKERIKGLVINKFRGDKTILDPGIKMIEEKANIPVTGVLPYIKVSIDDEDSLSSRLASNEKGLINIDVIRLPRVSNFTDFAVFEQIDGVKVRYITSPKMLQDTDFLIIPGSKNTIKDLLWLRESGFEAAIKKYSKDGIIFGVCGGYQMLGMSISDPDNVEEGGTVRGMELLEIDTVLKNEKVRRQTSAVISGIKGELSILNGLSVSGYEIHMGVSTAGGDSRKNCNVSQNDYDITNYGSIISNSRCNGSSDFLIDKNQLEEHTRQSIGDITSGAPQISAQNKNVYGTYLHGFFDEDKIALSIAQLLAEKKGVALPRINGDGTNESISKSYKEFKEKQYDILADMIRANMDMKAVYEILN